MDKAERSTFLLQRVLRFWFFALLGALFIGLNAWITIPFYPVPWTLQTFAIFCLAFTMKPNMALASVGMYLLLGTIGLPVFAGKGDVFWMCGKTAGFLFSFPVAVFITSKLLEKKRSVFLAAGLGQSIIMLVGFLWLSFFIGVKLAFQYGFLPFIIPGVLKIVAAYFLTKKVFKSLWIH